MNFDSDASEVRLSRPTSQPLELADLLREVFQGLFRRDALYRATGVILADLVADENIQYTLFEDPLRAEKVKSLYAAIDEQSRRYGKHTLHMGGSHAIEAQGSGKRGTPTVREQTRLYGETRRRHLPLPVIHVKV